ncbi:MAG: molybdopterin-guanine dinucleotide biosynthesis protein B [Firmicutes bacterium]|nr:molybdopterin-guanine dinucleotide biosynthesis protein B [Bacillota bacterium]
MLKMPPIFSVIGHSKTGKTTLIRGLIRELQSRGYRVGVIKHDPLEHGEVDRKGSDTANFWEEGSQAVVLSSPSRLALFRRVEKNTPPEEIVPLCGKVDYVILEGYKRWDYPKIVAWSGDELEVEPRQLLALVYDPKDREEVLGKNKNKNTVLFCRDDIKNIADFLEKNKTNLKRVGE